MVEHIRIVLRSPCRHKLFIDTHWTWKEKFRSRIFLRLGVTLTAKDRASARSFLPFSKWNCTITFHFTLSTPLCDAYLSMPCVIHQNILLLQKQNATAFSRDAPYVMRHLSFRLFFSHRQYNYKFYKKKKNTFNPSCCKIKCCKKKDAYDTSLAKINKTKVNLLLNLLVKFVVNWICY